MTKILTVDSEEAAVERMVNILESNNYQAQSATTWTEAVDAIAHGQPDLVLLNLEMPIVQGDVLIEFIREEGFEVPIIVVSFPVEEAEAKALLEQGVYGMVEKPYEDKMLIEKNRACARHSRIRGKYRIGYISRRRRDRGRGGRKSIGRKY